MKPKQRQKHISYQDAVRFLLDKRGQSEKKQKLQAHLDLCEDCRSLWSKAKRTVRFLSNPDSDMAVPSEWELSGIMAAAIPSSEGEARLWSRGWMGAAAATGLAGLLMVIGLLVWPVTQSEFRIKGIGQEEGLASFSVYCIEPTNRTVSEIVPGGSCPLEHLIQFSYSSTGDFRYLFIFGRQENQVLWYHPRPPSRSSIAIQKKVQDEVIPGAVRLSINHEPGDLCVFGVFSQQPAQMEAIVDLKKPPPGLFEAYRLCFRVTL